MKVLQGISGFEPILTCKEASLLDTMVQEECKLPPSILMENAGRSAAEFLHNRYEGPWVIVAGKGNNGGDALVIARHLILKGVKDLTVVVSQKNLGELSSIHLRALSKEGCRILEYFEDRSETIQALRCGNTLIDGIFGIGLQGAAQGVGKDLIHTLNDTGKRIAAVDVPSGLGDDYIPGNPVVHAEETLTFEVLKLPQFYPEARTHCGAIHRLSAGFPRISLSTMEQRYQRIHPEGLCSILSYPVPWTYKHKRGPIAVFASSTGTTGAGLLCSESILRSGAGLVSLFADSAVYPVLASQSRSLMVKPLPPVSELNSWIAPYSAVLVGPGWGRGSERIPYIQKLLKAGKRGVIDADGIHLLSLLIEGGEGIDLSNWVLTPHPGEFCQLVNCSKEDFEKTPIPHSQRFVKEYGCTLVVKGHVTYIVAPNGQVRIYDGMNPLLATAGTGDVLAGIIAGFLGQGMDPLSSAMAGVLILGEGAKEAETQLGYFLSEDLLPFLSQKVHYYGKKSRNLR